MTIPLLNTGDRYYKQEGKQVTVELEGRQVTGIIRTEHPNFDPSLVRNEHYYGEIRYFLEVKD